jgi:hypothetical protein
MGSTYKISKNSNEMDSKSVGFTPTRIFIDHLTAKFHQLKKQNELKILNGLFSKFLFPSHDWFPWFPFFF